MCYNYTGREYIPLGHLSSPRSHRLYFSFLPLLLFCSLVMSQFVCCDSLSRSTLHLHFSSSLLFLYIFPLSSSSFSGYHRFLVLCSLSRALKALERSDKMPLSNLRESSCFCTASRNAPKSSSSPERHRKQNALQ